MLIYVDEPEMILVNGGTFTMGCKNGQDTDSEYIEKPAHNVKLDSYLIGKHPVTNELWEQVMNGMSANPMSDRGCNLPVTDVSWETIVTRFLPKLNAVTKKEYRLPTEAEWEYAAHGGEKSRDYRYSGSNTIGEVAWYDDNSDGKIHPVTDDTKKPNELGIYGMSGNVWEWCSDRFGIYNKELQENPKGPTMGDSMVYRGGCWQFPEKMCRVCHRSYGHYQSYSNQVGFRLAMSA